jgi:hypothetical protein
MMQTHCPFQRTATNPTRGDRINDEVTHHAVLVAGAALSWGVYVPFVHRAAFELKSNLRIHVCCVFSSDTEQCCLLGSVDKATMGASGQLLNCDWVLIWICASRQRLTKRTFADSL